MIDVGTIILYGGAVVLGGIALARRDDSFRLGLVRAAERAVIILPRMIFALIAASFIVELIPRETIVAYLGFSVSVPGNSRGQRCGSWHPRYLPLALYGCFCHAIAWQNSCGAIVANAA